MVHTLLFCTKLTMFTHGGKLSAVSNCLFLPKCQIVRCQIVYGVKLSGVKLFVFTHGVKLSGVKLSAVLNCPRCQIDLQQILGTYKCRSTPPALLRLCLRRCGGMYIRWPAHPPSRGQQAQNSPCSHVKAIHLHILCCSLFQNWRFFLYVKQFD